jgi:CCR4-NOT transcriptional regulation complex NOT5 subunit
LAKTNYSYEKRQRELAKKKKQEEKRQRKASRQDVTGTQPAEDSVAPAREQTPQKAG